ncbi:hypothetical protein BC831DRAFT_466428 [Entophlyctis helioformis]|nr:hypothetical protein BC831DRAFT_466428 [Entophlyctis helioformis]
MPAALLTALMWMVLVCMPLRVQANAEKLVIRLPLQPSSSDVSVDAAPFEQSWPVLRWPYTALPPQRLQTWPLASTAAAAFTYFELRGLETALSGWPWPVAAALGAIEARINWPASDPTDFGLSLVCATPQCRDVLVKISAVGTRVPVPTAASAADVQPAAQSVRFGMVLEPCLFGAVPASTLPAILLALVVAAAGVRFAVPWVHTHLIAPPITAGRDKTD